MRLSLAAAMLSGVLGLSMALESEAQDVVTAAAVIAGARGALNDVLDKARADGQILLADAALHANAMLDRIEQMLGENLQKPIYQLDQTLQNEIAGVRYVVDAVRQTAAQLPMCIGNEAELALSGLKGGLASALNSIPLVDGEPIAYLIQQPSSRSPYTVVREEEPGSPISLVLRGANLWNGNEICELSAQARPLYGDAQSMSVDVVYSDAEKIQLALDSRIPLGEWLITVEAEVRRSFIGCLSPRNESVSASINVIPPTSAKVTIAITPSCAGFEECRRPFEGSCTNGSENGDKHCPATYGFGDAACEYVRVDDFTSGGRAGNVSAPVRSGNTVTINSTADRRPRFRGGTSRVFWSGVLVGRKRVAPVLQEVVEMPLDAPLKAGNSAGFALEWEPPPMCEVHAFTIGGAATFSDGRMAALPEQTVLAGLAGTSAGNGLRAQFNALTRAGTIEFAGTGCL